MPVKLLVLLLATLLTIGCAPSTPTPSLNNSTFTYQVRVLTADTDEPIENAEVILEVIGQTPLNAFTDTTGLARIFVSESHAGKPGRLFIKSPGFKKCWQHIDLYEEVLPKTIRLQRESITTAKPFTPPPPPSSPATPTSPPTSPTPYPTPSPTSTLTPTPPPTSPSIAGFLAVPLLFGTEVKVYIFDINGKTVGVLGNARQPDFTLDGTTLIVNGDGGRYDKLRISDPSGNNWREIGNPLLAGHSHPAWSPDGKYVIYDDNTLGNGNYHIYIRDINETTGEGQILTTSNGPIVDTHSLHPLWGQNNNFIFRGCNTWDNGQRCGIWMMRNNHGTPVQLTDNYRHIPTDIYNEWIVYVSDEEGNWNVYTLNITTRTQTLLTASQAQDGLATISPDGQFVAFLSDREDSLSVWYIPITGGTSKKLFNIPQTLGGLTPNSWSDEKMSWAVY